MLEASTQGVRGAAGGTAGLRVGRGGWAADQKSFQLVRSKPAVKHDVFSVVNCRPDPCLQDIRKYLPAGISAFGQVGLLQTASCVLLGRAVFSASFGSYKFLFN